MFGWFKKKVDKEAELRAKLAASLENYISDSEDDTSTTFTDIEVEGRTVRVAKIKVDAIEELTLTEFEEDVTVNHLTNDINDPWAGVKKR